MEFYTDENLIRKALEIRRRINFMEQVLGKKLAMTYEDFKRTNEQKTSNEEILKGEYKTFTATSSNYLYNFDMFFNSLEEDTLKDVIKKRFGLYGNDVHTLAQLAKELNLKVTKVKQMEQKAMRKYKHPSRIRILKNEDYTDVVLACKVVEGKGLNMFATDKSIEKFIDKEKENKQKRINKKFPNQLEKKFYSSIEIENLKLSKRAFLCLKRTGIDTLQDLLEFYIDNGKQGFTKIRNLGAVTAEEIMNKIKELPYWSSVELERKKVILSQIEVD